MSRTGGQPVRALPTPTFLARLKPNTKGGLYLVKPMEIGYRYVPRLGRYEVHNEGEPGLWETQDEALAAARRFHNVCCNLAKPQKPQDPDEPASKALHR